MKMTSMQQAYQSWSRLEIHPMQPSMLLSPSPWLYDYVGTHTSGTVNASLAAVAISRHHEIIPCKQNWGRPQYAINRRLARTADLLDAHKIIIEMKISSIRIKIIKVILGFCIFDGNYWIPELVGFGHGSQPMSSRCCPLSSSNHCGYQVISSWMLVVICWNWTTTVKALSLYIIWCDWISFMP